MKPWENGLLKVSENKRYFQNGDKPFFWLGDTAWLLLCHLTKEQIAAYLENRAEKGFNVIQVTISHKWPTQTVDGKQAFIDGDMTKPDLSPEGFWDLLDYAVKKAEELGLYMGLLPCWGGRFKAGDLNMDNVVSYIEFLTDRYKDAPNIIWITGGDIKGDSGFDFWTLMGETLKKHNPDKLVTFHPFGRTTTTDFFPNSDWLDFYMFQSGHRRYDQGSLNQWDDSMSQGYWYGEDNWRYISRVDACGNIKPVLDGEPSYEQIPQGLHDPSQPFWQDYDVRRFAYWSVLSGCAGFTYGHNAIMQFHRSPDEVGAYGCTIPWYDAIHSPGTDQMTAMANLMNSVPFWTGKAAQELLADEPGEKYERISVFAGEGFVICYDYTGRDIYLKAELLDKDLNKAYWINPVTGVKSYIGTIDMVEDLKFVKPSGVHDHTDWLLFLTK